MPISLKILVMGTLISVLFLCGCATNRSVVDISLPVLGEISKSNGKEIFINSVIDNRKFEIKPSEPSTPSLDPGEEQGDKIKLRAIARKRNGFGMGLGDILLSEDKSVDLLINTAIRQALIENGYKVVSNKEQITNNTYIVDAKINKLWSWMNPGFFAITLSTEISTEIAVKNNNITNEKVVSVNSSDTFQTGIDSNWVEVMQSALKAYISELKLKIK